VEMAGGIPLFADIDPDTYCMDIATTGAAEGEVIIPVHLFGGMTEMDDIMAMGVPVIEDASQAIGSKYKGRYAGTIGDCGIFSFNQSKTISCGEGGMLITNDDNIAHKAKLVRNHGEVVDPDAGIVGYNYRMTEIEAAIAYHRFQNLDRIIAQRKQNVDYFGELLATIPGVTPQWINPDVDYSWYVYSFEVENNRKVAKMMTEAGIWLRPGYITRPLNLAYDQSCPVCEDVWANKLIVTDVISKTREDIDHFISVLRQVMNV
jgi:perosamine synthetase